jgi:hypothetical protein
LQLFEIFSDNVLTFLFLFQSLSAARPLVSVYSDKNEPLGTNVSLPAVFKAPIRPDIVNFVHANMEKNHRQPYSVNKDAGIVKCCKLVALTSFGIFFSCRRCTTGRKNCMAVLLHNMEPMEIQ